MKFEDLDSDTQEIVNAMCEHTGMTKEKSILCLVEFGMLAMMTAVNDESNNKKFFERIKKAVNDFPGLRETANIYKSVWT